MSVRKISATTFSLIVLIIALNFLLPGMRRVLPDSVWYLFYERFPPQYYIGSYHSFILSASAWLIVVVGVIDAILNNRVALDLLSPLRVPIVLSMAIIILNNHPGGKKLMKFIREIKEDVGTGNNHISD
jgi:hypothetical protein